MLRWIAASCVALSLGALGEPGTPPTLKSVQIVAEEVADGFWGTGSARREALEAAGYDWREVQELVNEMAETWTDQDKPQETEGNRTASTWVPDPDGSVLTARGGVNWYFDQYETYYNLPMDGVVAIARAHGIAGEYWEREDGAKMLGEYIMLATNNSIYPVGTLVPCSLGMGISLDTGSFAERNPYQVDIAVDW